MGNRNWSRSLKEESREPGARGKWPYAKELYGTQHGALRQGSPKNYFMSPIISAPAKVPFIT